MNKLFVFAAAGLITMASCTKERIMGNGAITTENRNVGSFLYVTSNGSTNVHISKGRDFSVQVKGYTNLLPYMETTVGGNTLGIGYKNGSNVKNDNVEVYVTTPVLETVTTNGSANIDVKGAFVFDKLNTNVTGSGNVDIDAGTAQNFGVEISGSGSVKAFGLSAANADVYITGSGTAEVNAVVHLKVNITGSGVVYYKSSPVIQSYLGGSGKLIRKP